MIDKRFKINTLITYGANAIVMGSGFILMFLINRFAGIQTYGELAVITSTAGIIASLLTARSGEAVTRFFVREKTYGNLQNAKLVVLIGLSVDFILGIFVFSLFYIMSNTIAINILERPELAWSVWIYGFITLSIFVRGSMIGYFQSHEYFKVLNSIQILEAILKVSFLLVSFFYLEHININYVIYSYVSASFFVTLYIVIIFSRRFVKEFKGVNIKINKVLIKEYFSFNMKTFLSTTLKAGTNNIDNLILGYFTDTRTIGVYQTLKNILLPVNFIITPFYMITVSTLTKYYENKKYHKFNFVIKNITIRILFISSLIMIILYFLLENYLKFQHIFYTNSINNAFIILGLLSVLNITIWWGRIFIMLYNPTIPIYSNFLLLINQIFISIFLFKLNLFNDIVTISLSALIAYIPSWLFIPILYTKFLKNKVVNEK